MEAENPYRSSSQTDDDPSVERQPGEMVCGALGGLSVGYIASTFSSVISQLLSCRQTYVVITLLVVGTIVGAAAAVFARYACIKSPLNSVEVSIVFVIMGMLWFLFSPLLDRC